jgi:hypothetical protein
LTFLSVEDGYDAPMKYLVFIYGDASGSSPEKQLQGLRDLTKLKDELARSGELVSGEGLTFPGDGRIVQVRGGERVITDGPFGEAKEQLAGFFMVDVVDDERAQQLAARVSAVVDDRVELRGIVLSS